MRFYKQPHAFYAGIDLHAMNMFTHILDAQGATHLHARSQARLPTHRADFELSRCACER